MLTVLLVMAALVPSVGPAPALQDIHLVQQEQDPADRMWQVLRLQDLMPILQEEAVREASRMEGAGLIAGGGLPWARVVGRIHEADRMEALFRDGVRDAFSRMDRTLVDRALDFQASGLGRRVIGLEGSARRAMLEDGVDADARAAFAQSALQGQPRADQILQLIDRADLVAPNVAGGLNAAIAFSRGYAQGGGFDMAPDDRQMMADAWAQRDQIELDATEWLQGFLMLAYGPLNDAELQLYADHIASPEGQALSQMLFAGFDRVFAQTSFEMGLAAAMRGQGQNL